MKLPAEKIIYLEGAQNYTIVHLHNARPQLHARTLMYMQAQLGTGKLLRIHKSICINTDFVKESDRPFFTYVEMTNGKTFSISRRRRALAKLELSGISH